MIVSLVSLESLLVDGATAVVENFIIAVPSAVGLTGLSCVMTC